MSQSLSCVRCLRPITDDSLGELCETCRRSDYTRRSVDLDDPAALTPTARIGRVAASPPAPPPILPGYEILDTLGTGGMGMVYKAREVGPDRVVAVKLIRAATDPDARDRFRVEVRSLAKLDHPNIVRVYAVELDGREPYFTMEYVDGRGLDKRLAADGPLPPAEAARVVEAVARAVHAAHAAGVVHRDLKPANVLVAADGTPKVTDFGLAKRLDSDDGLTVTDAVLGTPGFMAPEQAGGRSRRIGPPADVYSLGATLYALLTGQPPFRGVTPLDTAEQVRSRSPVPPTRLRPEVPPELEAVVLRCLEKDPARRYPSAEALADDLARWREGRPTVARPPTRIERAWQTVRGRRPVERATAATLGVVLLASAWAAPVPKDSDPVQKAQRDLAAGRKVVLVGPTGQPKWHEWRLDAAALGKSPMNDETCSFQSIGPGLLELFPAPGVDRYRITAEVRQIWTRDRGEQPPADVGHASRTGLYFGHAQQPGTGGVSAHSFLAVWFNDWVTDSARKAGITRATARLDQAVIVQRPNTVPAEHTLNIASAEFSPFPNLYATEWRWVGAEVTPAGVRALWREKPDGPTTVLAYLPAATVRRFGTQMQDTLGKLDPNAGVQLPDWHPRMPIGIWCEGSSISIRNVVLEPLSE